MRPTVGLASRDGIIPLALSQDTGGPMARSVLDAAVALDAVAGVDAADPVTSRQEGEVPASYTQYLDEGALDGARIGYVPSMLGSNAATLRLWAQTRATLESLGATVVEVTPPTTWSPVLPNGFASVLSEGSGSTNEFKHDLDAYVATHLAPQVEARTLQGIVDSGRYVPSAAARTSRATRSPRRRTRRGRAPRGRTRRSSPRARCSSRRCSTTATSTRSSTRAPTRTGRSGPTCGSARTPGCPP